MSLTFVALAFSFAGPAQVDDAPLVRWYDIRALLSRSLEREPEIDLRTHIASAAVDEIEPDRYNVDVEVFPTLADEGVDDVVRSILEELDELGDFDVDARLGYLRVEGSERVQSEAAQTIADLLRLVNEHIDVELLRIPSALLPPGTRSHLSAEACAALVQGPGVQFVARRTVELAHIAELSTAGFESVLYDYSVEVAGGSMTADPNITTVRTGVEFAVSLRRAVGGGLLARAFGREGQLERPVRTFVLPAFANAKIQLPRMRTQVFVGSGHVTEGGGLLVGGGDGLDPLLVRFHHVGPGDGAEAAFLACGELSSVAVRPSPLQLRHAAPSGGWGSVDPSVPDWLEEVDPVLEPSEVFDGLMDRFGAGAEPLRARLIGDRIYLPDAARRPPVLAHLQELTQLLGAETFEVELRYGAVPSGEVAALIAAPDEALAARLGARLNGVARGGDALLATAGSEGFYLTDYDVEIAQATAISDPIVTPCFLGASLWCMPTRSSEGQSNVLIDFTLHYGSSDAATIAIADWNPTPTTDLGDDEPQPIGQFELRNAVELPGTHLLHAHRSMALRDDVWALVAAVADTRDATQTQVVLIRVSGRR